MKRWSVVLVAVFSASFLTISATSGAVFAASCTPQWHVVQSATIYALPVGLHHTSLGTVSLARDGCGDIQATLTPTANQSNPDTHGALTITDANTGAVIYTGTSAPSQTSSILAGYGGVGIFATGTLGTIILDDQGRASTPTDYGN